MNFCLNTAIWHTVFPGQPFCFYTAINFKNSQPMKSLNNDVMFTARVIQRSTFHLSTLVVNKAINITTCHFIFHTKLLTKKAGSELDASRSLSHCIWVHSSTRSSTRNHRRTMKDRKERNGVTKQNERLQQQHPLWNNSHRFNLLLHPFWNHSSFVKSDWLPTGQFIPKLHHFLL